MKFMCALLAGLMATLFSTNVEARSKQSWLAEVSAIAASIEIDEPNAPVNPAPNPVVKRSECKVCNGTGKVRSGDGLAIVECSNCVPDSVAMVALYRAEGCRCGDTCDCDPCQCGIVEVAYNDLPCADGSCPVGEPCSGPPPIAAAAHHGGNCAGGACGVGLRVGQPVRNAARLGVGAGRVAVRGVGAIARGAAQVATARFRARQNHGGPFPLMRAWRCRRGRCG